MFYFISRKLFSAFSNTEKIEFIFFPLQPLAFSLFSLSYLSFFPLYIYLSVPLLIFIPHLLLSSSLYLYFFSILYLYNMSFSRLEPNPVLPIFISLTLTFYLSLYPLWRGFQTRFTSSLIWKFIERNGFAFY